MNVTLPTKDLAAALARLKPLCGSMKTLPILGAVLLRAEGNKLTIEGTDLDLHLTLELAGEVESSGVAAVPCGRLQAGIAKMSGETCNLRMEKKSGLICSSGDFELRLFAYPADEFPAATNEGALVATLQTSGGLLAGVLAKALPFASDDETRFVLNGVFFTNENSKLRCVGTDGRRMIICSRDVEFSGQCILPPAAAKLLVDLVGEEAVTLTFGESGCVASGAGWKLVSKLIEGNYPNVQQVVPALDYCKVALCFDRTAALAALAFAGCILADKKGGMVKLEGRAEKGGELVMTTLHPDMGEASARLACDLIGPPLAVGYAARFLADALKSFDEEKITLRMPDANGATRMEEPGTLVVLMPMRIV